MANTKEYFIKINGLEESINAVDSLNKQLEAAEARIKAIDAKKISISSSSSGGGGGSRTSELSDEDKLLKQIEATQSKINQADMADYKVLLDKKNELKELVKEQKSMAAEARLSDNAYANTMLGMKQHLADIKAAMQTVDLNDTDTFEKLTKDANELNSKLLEIEKSYGQFGRNVGNYASAAEGFKKLPIEIGGVVQEFDSARQALKALKQEMETLEVKKSLGIITEEESERLKEMIPTVKTLKSTIDDAGKPMDALMDSMQSIVALAQTGKGLAAFFGLEDTGIEKSIQDLVALQNAMQGLQTIQKQMQASDGIFKWINKGNSAIDNYINKLFRVKKATTEVTTASKAQAAATSTVATASKAATTAEVAQTTATAGLTIGMKAATVAATVLRTALKAIGIGVITAGIAVALEGLKELAKSLLGESEAAKKAREEAEKLKEKIEEQRKSFIDASAQYHNTASRLSHLRTEYMNTNDQLKKTAILKEASEQFKSLGISVKSVSDAETVLVKQGHDVIELLRIQGNAAAISAMRMEAYKNSFKILLEDGYDAYAASVIAGGADKVREYDEILDKLQDRASTLKENLNIDDASTNAVKKTGNDILEAERDLNNLRIQNMKEGLRKVITQLEEERKQKLAKVEQSGIMVEERRLEINKLYNRKIEEATKKHLETLQNEYKNKWKDIDDELEKSLQKQAKYIEESTRNTRASADALRGDLFKNVYSYGIQSKGSLTNDTLKDLGIVSRGNPSNELDELGYRVADSSKKFTKEINKLVDLERKLSYLENRIAAETYKGLNTDELKTELNEAQKTYEDYYAEIRKLYDDDKINLQKNLLYQESYSDKLVDIAHQRYAAMDLFWQLRKKAEKEALDEEYEASEDAYSKQLKANEKFYTDENEQIKNHLREQVTELNKALNESRISNDEYNKQLIAINKEAQNKQESLEIQFNKNLIAITDDRANKRKELLEERAKKEAEIESEKLQDILQYYRDYYTALNNLEERQPVLNDWGIINWKETKKNTKELIESYKEIAESLNQERKYITSSDILSDEEKEAALREIDGFMADLGDRLDAAKKFNANMFGEMLDSLMPYIQALGNAIQTVMEANNKYQDYLFDKQQEDLDKQNDILQKKLNEQEDILQKHKSAVDDIENELANARGDRRSHLIDQLNQEIAAQRRAQAEKEQIEKKEEALKKKQDELDKQRKKAEYNRNLQSILVSGAMTISNAFATSPFVPVGIAMGALATTLTAYQYAMAKKAKPYAKGGLLEGPSHQNGGIPVGNTGIEVEGKEYVIRKKSTRENVPVLDFINKSERKLDLDDFIDFYSSGKAKRMINSISPRNKYADGGKLALPNVDISNFSDRTIIVKDEGVYQVQVVDVINKAADVKRVQVLAGLNPNNSI